MISKAFYRSPELIASIDVQTVLKAASGFVSSVTCWEEPNPTCSFQQ
jgi:hypothetical protein